MISIVIKMIKSFSINSFSDNFETNLKFRIGFVLFIFAIVCIFYIPLIGNFSADSYGYILLGKSIFKDFSYSANVVIDYYSFQELPQPSRRFPPLYPIFVGLVDYITSLGVYSGVILNFLIILFSFVAIQHLATSLNIKKLVLTISLAAFLLTDIDFVGEVIGGKSIPLSFLLLLIQLNIIFNSKLSNIKSIIYIGIISGLMFLNRYDTLFYVFFIPFSTFLFNPKNWSQNLVKTATYYSVFILCFSPWGIRNLELYGQFITSDNKLSAISTYGNGTQLCFWANGLPATLFEDFPTWLSQRTTYFFLNLTRFFLLKSLFLLPFILIVKKRFNKLSENQLLFLFIYGLYTIFNLAAISLTPFADTRYYSIAYFMAALTGCIVYSNSSDLIQWNSTGKILFIAFTLNTILFISYFLTNYKQHIWGKSENLNEKILQFVNANRLDKSTTLISCLFAEELNYKTNLHTIYPPRNRDSYLYNQDYEAWIKFWKIDLLVVDNRYLNLFPKRYRQKKLDENYSILKTELSPE
ncbi:MAG: hypothetical protein K2Q22_10115 [Cytophagales bacterium]|nr:hypothetical protein [Cytophagales bacterium]